MVRVNVFGLGGRMRGCTEMHEGPEYLFPASGPDVLGQRPRCNAASTFRQFPRAAQVRPNGMSGPTLPTHGLACWLPTAVYCLQVARLLCNGGQYTVVDPDVYPLARSPRARKVQQVFPFPWLELHVAGLIHARS